MTFDEWYEKDGKFDDHCGADKKELAKLAWQARGELDAAKIKELEAKLDKAREALNKVGMFAVNGKYSLHYPIKDLVKIALQELDK